MIATIVGNYYYFFFVLNRRIEQSTYESQTCNYVFIFNQYSLQNIEFAFALLGFN